MQVTETRSEGLRREFSVVIPAVELDAKVNDRLGEMKDRVRINGFRPGKVPVEHLKRVYGRAAMAEAIEAAVRDVNAKIVADNNFRLAMQPEVKLPTEQKDVEQVIEGKSDLSYTVAMEILAPIVLTDFKTIALEKSDRRSLRRRGRRGAAADRGAEPSVRGQGRGAKAEKDDRVVISFVGSLNGEPFEGGKGEDVAVHLGSGQFIPGFEDQLIGAAAGDNRKIKATFPANYPAANLAGKEAEFDTIVKSVESPGKVAIDDEFAKSLGIESLDKLKDAVKARLQQEHDGQSRLRLKRALFDALDERHKFDVPPALLDQEYNNLWNAALEEMKRDNKTFADENTTEEKEQKEYRRIADRRVRLGLLLDEIARNNNLVVTDEETTRAVVEHIRQFPGREQQMWDMFRNNPEALASVRAPVLETKVVDYLVALAKVTDKKVTREELYRDDDEKAA